MVIAPTPLSACPSCSGNLRSMTAAHIPNVIADLPARFWDVLVVSMLCPDCGEEERMFVSCRCANYHADCEELARRQIIELADSLNRAAQRG